jgi:lysyl-tRNA synthetase class II
MLQAKSRERLRESNDFLASGNGEEIADGCDKMPNQLDVDYIRALAHGMPSAVW